MKIETFKGGIRYTLSNDDLKEGDEVFPIGRGRINDEGEFILNELEYADYLGFPDDPHILEDLNYSDYKPYQVRTNHGFSPIESYYKIIKKEKKIVEYKEITGGLKITTRNEWVEI